MVDSYQDLKDRMDKSVGEPVSVKPSYEEVVADLTEAVHIAASLRQAMLDAGFTQIFADEVAKTFLWRSLGLGGD